MHNANQSTDFPRYHACGRRICSPRIQDHGQQSRATPLSKLDAGVRESCSSPRLLNVVRPLYLLQELVIEIATKKMQWLVRKSVEHLDAIDMLTRRLTCSGFMWPLFITGCEAEDKFLRKRIVKTFEERDKLCIANVTAARKVLYKVWRRRDEGASDVSWHEVMVELGIDIFLS